MSKKKQKTKELWDYFTEKSGSKKWPSDDPKDSPFNKITCKICGWSFKYKAYGEFRMDEYPIVEPKMINHLMFNHFKEVYVDN